MNMELAVEDYLQSLANIGLTQEEIVLLSKKNEFIKRRGGKISAESFLAVLLSKSTACAPSLNDLAICLDSDADVSVSKQAVAKKMNDSLLNLVKAVLGKAISAKLSELKNSISKSLSGFKRLIVQDSTIIRIPTRLFDEFSGVKNAHSCTSNARIQASYDLIAENFVSFAIDPYSKNDLKAAPELDIQRGDLSLRDRGYITYDEIERHVKEGADTIYRHKFQNTYLDPVTEEPISLLQKLQDEGTLDMEVLLNNKEKTRIRLVAVPVPEEVANLRKMQHRRDSRAKTSSKELFALMSWSIFITTISDSIASIKEILSMYELRWRIEIIFKAWKSNMNFDKLHNVSAVQLRIIINARLVNIVLTTRLIYAPAYERIKKDYGRRLSLMKLTRYLTLNNNKIKDIIEALFTTEGKQPILDSLARYCTYDKRKRINFTQQLDFILESWSLG